MLKTSPRQYCRALFCGAALAVLVGGGFAVAAPLVQHDQGGGHETDSGHTDHEGGQGARGGQGRAPGETGAGGRGRSFEDIVRDVAGEEEDSDRPSWAGVPGGKDGAGGGRPDTSGTARGDLYGDLWVILRDPNGVPILNSAGFVQPIDANGNLIPLDEEGAPIDATLPIEVELGRLNVGRAPVKVLDRRAEEVIAFLNDADEVSLDAAGRIVVTIDGVAKTIDSPLENLAIYVALMTTGTIPGVDDLPGTALDFLVDGKFTAEDLMAARSFLAGASDKSGDLTPDEVAYINAFLNINDVTTGDVTYSSVDYSGFTYDRQSAYGDVTTTVLVRQSDGSWVPTEINVYDTIFGGQDYTGSGDLTAFTQAADDARAVVEFIHEYAVPAESL